LGHIPLSVPGIVSELADANKFRLIDWRLMTDKGAFAPLVYPYHWLPAILGGFFLTMATHGTDQDMVQRLLTCKDSAGGKRSLWMSGFLGIGITCLFITVGMLLFIYVRHLPPTDAMAGLAAQLAADGKNNQFLIHYIVKVLPAGVTGIVLAALVAAALSSLGSAINATSSTAVTDFYQQYIKPQAEPAHYVRISRFVSLMIGTIVIAVALLCADFSAHHPEVDLLSIALGIMTFFYGALLGIFLVGLFSKTRGNSTTNIVGAVLSIVLIVCLKFFTPVAWPWFTLIGAAVTAGVSLLGRTPDAVLAAHEEAGRLADQAS
jgi:Na+/proline symporter